MLQNLNLFLVFFPYCSECFFLRSQINFYSQTFLTWVTVSALLKKPKTNPSLQWKQHFLLAISSCPYLILSYLIIFAHCSLKCSLNSLSFIGIHLHNFFSIFSCWRAGLTYDSRILQNKPQSLPFHHHACQL